MVNVLDITRDFIPIREQENDSNPRRLTLIHKRGDNLVCALSRGLEEVVYGKPVEDAFIIRMSGPEKVCIAYEGDVTYKKRETANMHYTIAENRSELSNTLRSHKIPFMREKGFVSEIVANEESLNSKINDLIEAANKRLFKSWEKVADVGYYKAAQSKEVKELKEEFTRVGRLLYDQVNGYFHEEVDDTPIRKHDILARDIKLNNYFEDSRKLSYKLKWAAKKYGVGAPMLSLAPLCSVDILEHLMRSKYEKRFDRVEENEREAIVLSEFALGNPKLISGIRRGFYDCKARANLGIYALQLAATGVAWNYGPSLAGSALAGISVLTGYNIAKNAIKSRGVDYSGFFSTLINGSLQRNWDKVIKSIDSSKK